MKTCFFRQEDMKNMFFNKKTNRYLRDTIRSS